MIAQLPSITVDTSTEGFLRPNDPTLQTYNDFRNQFGRDIPILLAITPTEVFDTSFLQTLQALHEELEGIDKIHEVTSLINIRDTRGEMDQLIVSDLLENIPETEEEMRIFRQRVLSNPLYMGNIISPDARITLVTLKTDTFTSHDTSETDWEDFDDANSSAAGQAPRPAYITGEENLQIVRDVREVVQRYNRAGFSIQTTGSPALSEQLQFYIAKNMTRFMGLGLLTISGFLFLLFRRISAVLLPLLVIILSLLSTLGSMALAKVPITVPSQILPSFLVAVGVGYTVHLLVVFFQAFDKLSNKEEALAAALGHSAVPIVMTAVTTIAGLLSFTVSDLLPIAHFGLFSALGVAMALLYTLTLLPALLAIVPLRVKKTPRPENDETDSAPGLLDHFLLSCANLGCKHPWKIVCTMIVILIIAGFGLAKLRYSHVPQEWLPESDPVRIATDFVDEEFLGSGRLEIIIDTHRENGIQEPEVLRRMEELAAYVEKIGLEQDNRLGKTISLLDIIKETNQALNENQLAFYSIPQDRALIAQELLLFENSGSDDLEEFTDSQFSMARMSIRTKRVDSFINIDFFSVIEQDFKDIIGDQGEVRMTGLLVLMTTAMKAVIFSLSRSYGIALLLITPLMMLLIGSVRGGLISMVPNITPIFLTLGLMGWFDLPMDIFTLLIGSIAIGLAVDDTIHFIHSFQRYYHQSGDAELAVRQTMRTTGKALLFTSMVLATGFFIFMLSAMSNLFNFGLLTGFAISAAFICDVTITPALLILASRTKKPWNMGQPDELSAP